MTQPQGPGQGTPQPPPQQGGGMSVGLGSIGRGGIPRVKVDAGDYHPSKLWSAVASGEGFAKPRMMGLAMVGLSIVLTVVNTILVLFVHIYYPYLYSLGAIFWWAGLWLVITGQPQTPADGSKAAMWGRAGLGAFLVIGVLMGIAMIFMNWEHMLASSVTGN
jgi:hypothetical protein